MTGDAPTVRHILVALGTPAASLEALSMASALAARLGAQLEGLFVEDMELLRAAGLPFTTQLSLPSGERRPLERHAVEAELRAVAAAAREALSAAAAACGVRWTFRVTRGSVRIELLQASRGADLLVVGRNGRGNHGARAAAGRSAEVRRRQPGDHRAGAPPAPVLVAYDGSPGSEHALDIATQLAGGAPLVLVLLAPALAEAQHIAEHARSRHPHEKLEARWAGGTAWHHLVRSVHGSGPLVVSARMPAITEAGPESVFEATAAPLLIVR